MNKTKIPWTERTWNPVTGCKNGCPYCYARTGAKRLAGRAGYPASPHEFEPTFHPDRLDEPYHLKKPSRIFVPSMGELFGPWVPQEWIEAVHKVILENPQHTFLLLTKNPEGYARVESWPRNAWLGVSLTGEDVRDTVRLAEFTYVLTAFRNRTFISCEPLLGPIMLMITDWVIIGPRNHPTVQPKKGWVDGIVNFCATWHVPIFMKPELDYEVFIQDWPRKLRKEHGVPTEEGSGL